MPMVIRVGKYEGMMPLFSVDYYDPKTLSFNFSNDILITLEMPRYPTRGPFGESAFRCYSVHLLQRSLANTICWLRLSVRGVSGFKNVQTLHNYAWFMPPNYYVAQLSIFFLIHWHIFKICYLISYLPHIEEAKEKTIKYLQNLVDMYGVVHIARPRGTSFLGEVRNTYVNVKGYSAAPM